MIFPMDRDKLRAMYREAWRRRRAGEPLSPLDTQIADVVEQHPEYHAEVEADGPGGDYSPVAGQTNPFLHMGMHLAIREQVGTDRPNGVAAEFARLATRLGDPLAAEHLMMEALGTTLWEAQRNQTPPDESAFLERVRRL